MCMDINKLESDLEIMKEALQEANSARDEIEDVIECIHHRIDALEDEIRKVREEVDKSFFY